MLLEDKFRLEKNLKNDNEDRALELTQKTFIFVNRARDQFQKSPTEDKRVILEAIGSNFLFKDKKLIIYAEKLFLILEEGLKGISGEILPLEP